MKKIKLLFLTVALATIFGNSVNAQTYGMCWNKAGNTVYVSQFLGSTNNIGFGVRTNNVQRVYFDTAFGTYYPQIKYYLNNEKFLHTTGGGGGGGVFENLFFGYKAGHAFSGTGYANTVIGREAGLALRGNSASSNVIVGYSAAATLKSGRLNTILGTAAGSAIDTGLFSTVLIGHHSGRTLKGNYSVYIGQSSGENATTGTDVVSVGVNSGLNNQAVGSVNIGANAGQSNTTATRRVCVGWSAGQNSLGTESTWVGFIAGQSAAGGDGGYNTGIGYGVGANLTTGSQNLFAGRLAGNACTSCAGNVFLGKGTGNGMTDGQNNVIIGADIPTTAGGASSNNELRIMTGLYGKYMNTNIPQIGFGVSNPEARLHLSAANGNAGFLPLKFNAGLLVGTTENGATEFDSSFYMTNSSANRFVLGGKIKDFVSQSNNSGTSETDLYTYTTKANSLASTGEDLIFNVSGSFNDATATSLLRFYFGGANIGETLALSMTGSWSANVRIKRISSLSIESSIVVNLPNGTIVSVNETNTGITFTNTNILKVTGEAGGASGGSNDITAKSGDVYWWGASNN